MKKMILLVVTLMSLALFAATPAWADTKIATINIQDLLQKLPQMKQIGNDLKKQFSDKQKQLTDAQDTFKKDADTFRRDNSVMADKDKQAAENKLFKQQQDLQKMQMDLQRDYMAAQNKEVDALMNKVKAVVETIAQKDKIDLVLVNASVAYAKKGMDITDQVLDKIK